MTINHKKVTLKNILRTFVLWLIPYFIISHLSYPIELFPKPIYSLSFFALFSLLNLKSGIILNKVEVKIKTLKNFFLVKNNLVVTLSLLALNFIEMLSHRAFIPGITLSVLSLIVAYIPANDDLEKQLMAIAYFFSIIFFFFSFV